MVLLYFALQRVKPRRTLKVLFTCDEEENSVVTEPTLTIPRCCRTNRPHTCTGAAMPSRSLV